MKTPLLLLASALLAVCSLTSCDVYGYPGSYGYSSTYYNSRPAYYGGGYSGYRPGNYSYNRGGGYCAPTPHHSSFGAPGRGFGGGPSFGGGGHHHH